jgi:ATP-dependent protease ClpP protease subunit
MSKRLGPDFLVRAFLFICIRKKSCMSNWKRITPKNNEPSEIDEPKFISFDSPNISNNDTQDNKIYFYKDVDKSSILQLTRQIDELTKQIKIHQISYNLKETPAIEIHICSDGGDLFSSMACVDKILNSKVPIHTYCEGVVASAATLLSVVGHKRFISPSSCMLIHQVTSGLWGNYREFKDEIKNLDLIMTLIRGVYLKKTKFKPRELEKLLSHDLYLSADECIKIGLADTILS